MLLWSSWLPRVTVVVLLLGLAACSTSSDRKAVYDKKAEHQGSLEVPPDLVEPQDNAALEVPAIASAKTTYSSFSGRQQLSDGQVLPGTRGDARLVRDGRMQWLEIRASADELWTQLMAFFRNQGFEIQLSDTNLGLIETSWQENRVNMPTNWFTRMLNALYDSGLRDKYRARLEKANNGITRIFITHRGMVEKATDDSGGEIVQTHWEIRESDPELEAEMMQRFLVYRGLDEAKAKAMAKNGTKQDRAVLKEDADRSYLVVNENFPRSWRRTGLALDRMGLLVEDRNRSAGMYYIKVTEEYVKAHENEKGWFASLFSASGKDISDSYILKLSDQGASTQVSLLDKDGKNINTEAGKNLLGQLQLYLR